MSGPRVRHVQRGARWHRPRRTAFTLVELLVALLLTSILLTAVGRITVQAVTMERDADRAAQDHERLARPFATLAEDLAQQMRVPNSVFVRLDANGQPEITVYCLDHEPLAGASATRVPHRVVYGVAQREDSSGLEWVRTSRTLLDQELARAEVLACGLEQIDFWVFAEGAWQQLTRGRDQIEGIRALRLSCRWVNDARIVERTYELAEPRRIERRRVR